MEDGDVTDDEIEEQEEGEQEEEGEEYSEYSRKYEPAKTRCCRNRRIDELSTPHKRIFLALWNEHAYHLPKDKVKNLKELLKQLYAMTPEETAKYFAELRNEAKAAEMRKRLKQKLRKYLLEKHHQKQRERAYKLFKRLLKCGIAYAAENPVPPLVSIRLRYLSDIILEQVCGLRQIEVPNRTYPDRLGTFLISIADWMAIAVERLYFAAQLSINAITDQEQPPPDETLSAEVPATYEDFGEPAGASTPKKLSLDPYYSFIPPSEPVATSTPKRPQKAKPQTKVPHYTFDQMKPPPEPLNRTMIEMPLYSFRRPQRSRNTSSRDSTGSASRRQNSTMYQTRNKSGIHDDTTYRITSRM